jgi:hypothetical protein
MQPFFDRKNTKFNERLWIYYILVSALSFDAVAARGLRNASAHLHRLFELKSSITEIVVELVEFTLPENSKFG